MGCYKFRMTSECLEFHYEINTKHLEFVAFNPVDSEHDLCKKSGSRSFGFRSCSCGGACLSSSLCFVSSDRHVQMKWGASSNCAPQSLHDGSPRACLLLCELNLQASNSSLWQPRRRRFLKLDPWLGGADQHSLSYSKGGREWKSWGTK